MSRSRPRTRRSLTVVIAAVLGASGLVATASGPPAGAAGSSAREQRAQVRAQQAEVASQVDALQGDQAQVAAALAALDENVRGQQAALADARHQLETSTAEAAQAEQAAAATRAEIDQLRQQVVAYAVDAYVSPPDEDLLRRLEAPSAQEDATKRALLEMRSGHDADALDALAAAQQRLEEQQREAEDARDRAASAAADAEQAVTSLTAAQAQQQAFAEQVRARLDERLADAAYLAQVDADLGQRIASEQAALAAAVRSAPAAPTSAGSGSAGTRGSSGGGGASATATASPASRRPPLVTVGGITVNAGIGDQLRQLLAAARADGISLGGYGWRDSRNQVALRGQNCGWSDYALYDMPPEQCSPPTARPGSSMHEQGLAIDFSADGGFIESRSDPAFRWLAANAGRFGFANLPSEPWHWSTTGS